MIPVSESPLRDKWGKDTAGLGFPWSLLGDGAQEMEDPPGPPKLSKGAWSSPGKGELGAWHSVYLHIRAGVTWNGG